jgi:hypothetical protein
LRCFYTKALNNGVGQTELKKETTHDIQKKITLDISHLRTYNFNWGLFWEEIVHKIHSHRLKSCFSNKDFELGCIALLDISPC